MYLAAYAFIGGVMALGIGIGFWLQGRLIETNQIITLPSAFKTNESSPILPRGSVSAAH